MPSEEVQETSEQTVVVRLKLVGRGTFIWLEAYFLCHKSFGLVNVGLGQEFKAVQIPVRFGANLATLDIVV